MLLYGVLVLLFTKFISGDAAMRPNACNNFMDYFIANTSKNCFYDPDMYLETPELIRKYAGKVESHKVTTEDGYILTMFRIPRSNAKDSILLQHPLSVNSRVWVGQGNESFAFFLWRNGYDVWLNNARGTLFSDKHVKLSNKNHRFWDFSFHEIGVYDIPSQLKLIKNITNRSKILYAGQSMGVTSGLIYSSLHSEEAKNSIKAFVFMATPCLFKYATSLLKFFVPYEEQLKSLLLNGLKLDSMLPVFLLPLFRMVVRSLPITLVVVNLLISLTFGWTPDEMDPAMLNFDAAIYVKAFSFKILVHYLQLLKSETTFQMFDYGEKKNLKLYNSPKPPLYPLEKISVPILLVSSYNDSLTTVQDSEILQSRIPKQVHGHLKLSGLNHMDYFIGKHRKIYYDEVLDFLNSFSKK